MSRYFDLSNNAVLFHDVMLPVDAFLTTHISEEVTLVNKIFEFAREIAQMKLSEKVLSLYSAFILLQDGKCPLFKTLKQLKTSLLSKHLCPDRNGLRNLEEISKLKEAVRGALQKELAQNPPLTPTKGDVSTCSLLVNKCTALRLDPLLLVQWISPPCLFQRAEHTAPEGVGQLPKELVHVNRVPRPVWRALPRAQLGQLHRLGR